MFGRLDAVVASKRELDAREAAWLRDVGAYDRSEEWRADGYPSCAAALRDRCLMSAGAARAALELARKLSDLPEVAAAFDEGAISRAHARVVADAFTPERADQLAAVERDLVDAARTHTPHELGALLRYLTDAIDGDGGAATDEARHERRRLHMSRTLDGMLATDGMFDAEAAEIHLAAINAEMERDRREHDSRSPAQRRADALTNLLRQSLDRAEVGSVRGARPHITVVVDVDALTGAPAGLASMLRAERWRAGFLSPATLERLACDCAISRVITNGRSEVLDVGRATRSRRRCGRPCRYATATAPRRVVTNRPSGAKRTTSCPGATVGRRSSRISSSCAGTTTGFDIPRASIALPARRELPR